METFTALKDLVDNPHYHKQKQEALNELNLQTIDEPIIDLIKGLNEISCCFTMQSCWGHFLHGNQNNPENTEPLPISKNIKGVDYRIAYIALCIENSDQGQELFGILNQLPLIDPEYIQFGCAEWFWENQVNSYALQVEPQRFKTWDKVNISYQEALHIEEVRNKFFKELGKIVQERTRESEKS